jgi:cytochrome c biogenesis protein CcdA
LRFSTGVRRERTVKKSGWPLWLQGIAIVAGLIISLAMVVVGFVLLRKWLLTYTSPMEWSLLIVFGAPAGFVVYWIIEWAFASKEERAEIRERFSERSTKVALIVGAAFFVLAYLFLPRIL